MLECIRNLDCMDCNQSDKPMDKQMPNQYKRPHRFEINLGTLPLEFLLPYLAFT